MILILEEQNIIAVYQYLLSRGISDEFVPGQAQMTPEKFGLQVDGRNSLQMAFDLVAKLYPSDLLTNGEMQLAVSEALNYLDCSDVDYMSTTNWNADKQFWPAWIFKFEVFGEYNHWCKQRNERYPRNNDQFWKETWKIWAGGRQDRVLKQGKNGDRFSSIALPDIKDMKRSFTANTTIRFADNDDGDGAENNFSQYADQF
jgi:hypothetical protein